MEPSVPYPADTELMANIVTSPHHLSATMVTGRIHRMTELFGRLAPGVDLETARAELRAVHASMVKQHPEDYSPKSGFRIDALRLRDQITSRARTVLLILMAASVLVFIIACSNAANLILARSVRREGELAVRAALGASASALRRTLLAESLLLCVAGAALGILSARPMVAILARYAARFSVRALDLTIDSSMLWIGAALAVGAAVLLAYVPRLPATGASQGLNLGAANLRVAGSTSRSLRIFAITQIAACFILLAGASMLLKTLLAMQAARTGMDTRQVLAMNVPVMEYGKTQVQVVNNFTKNPSSRSAPFRASTASRSVPSFPGGTRAPSVLDFNSPPTVTFAHPAKRTPGRNSAPSLPASSRHSAFPSSRAAISTTATARAVRWSSSSARVWHSACSPTRTQSTAISTGRMPS